MAEIPFLGRLFIREYLALLGSFVLIGLEIFVRLVTLALPNRIIRILYGYSRSLFRVISPQTQKARAKERAVVNPIAQATDFVDLCAHFGYYAEEHVVQTEDGYLLGVHRLAWRKGEEYQPVNSGEGSVQKKVVYLHHGLMMNSEVWVCVTEEERCLPFLLVERGFDVWLGNNRGNKYSKKSVRHSPTNAAFWNFSIDQFAFHDIPDTITYILSTTKQESLAYIGFSQGTAQAFATLSIHPTLNEKVDLFIALAPAMSPPGLANGIVASLVKSSPEVLFLAFGRRSILSSTPMWQQLLYPPIFVRVIDASLSFLFGWRTRNISQQQKLAAYPHLFSFTSTKSVVHWFQIIRNGKFQMFDDEVQGPVAASLGSRYYKVAKFPTRNIRTPVVLVYGGSDSLVNIDVMLKELPKHTVVREIPKYEHLDFLWATDVDKLVFPHVLEALGEHSGSAVARRSSMHYASMDSLSPVLTRQAEDDRFGPKKQKAITASLDGQVDAFVPRRLLNEPSFAVNTQKQLGAPPEQTHLEAPSWQNQLELPSPLPDATVSTQSAPTQQSASTKTVPQSSFSTLAGEQDTLLSKSFLDSPSMSSVSNKSPNIQELPETTIPHDVGASAVFEQANLSASAQSEAQPASISVFVEPSTISSEPSSTPAPLAATKSLDTELLPEPAAVTSAYTSVPTTHRQPSTSSQSTQSRSNSIEAQLAATLPKRFTIRPSAPTTSFSTANPSITPALPRTVSLQTQPSPTTQFRSQSQSNRQSLDSAKYLPAKSSPSPVSTSSRHTDGTASLSTSGTPQGTKKILPGPYSPRGSPSTEREKRQSTDRIGSNSAETKLESGKVHSSFRKSLKDLRRRISLSKDRE